MTKQFFSSTHNLEESDSLDKYIKNAKVYERGLQKPEH